MKKPIGILGGTFDPIHHGHLRIALELYQQYKLQEIRFIPCYQQVLKRKASQASPKQRVAMLQLAIKNQPGFSIDKRELERSSPSFTVDTLDSLRQDLGPKQSLWLIIGSDGLTDLAQWQRWNELIHLAHIVVIPRPGFSLMLTEPVAEFVKQHQTNDVTQLKKQAAGKLYVANLTPLTISATAIRKQISKNISPRFLLPEAVLNYIHKEKIYKS